MPTADGYIRVSRRAGREGESFISPEVQQKKIESWAIKRLNDGRARLVSVEDNFDGSTAMGRFAIGI